MMKNKNILVIGGSSGIGLALVTLLSPDNNVMLQVVLTRELLV